MDYESLKKANELKKQITEFEDFIEGCKKVWQGKLVQEKKFFRFKRVPYGVFEEKSIVIESRIRNKMLDVLQEEIEILEKEFEKL